MSFDEEKKFSWHWHQNDEITCLRATLADALRRINHLESGKGRWLFFTIFLGHRNLIYIECCTFWLQKQWHYNQVQKVLLHRYLLYFPKDSVILFYSVTFNTIFSLEVYLLQFFSYFRYSKFHSFNIKVCSKLSNKVYLLHLIVVPQLIGGWQHNYYNDIANKMGTVPILSVLLLCDIKNDKK